MDEQEKAYWEDMCKQYDEMTIGSLLAREDYIEHQLESYYNY